MGNFVSKRKKKVMGNQIPKTYTFEIGNFSQRNNTPIKSPLFSNGSCNWYVIVYRTNKGMSLFLTVPNHLSRPHGWSRLAWFNFVIVNQSNAKSKSLETSRVFNEKQPNWGFKTDLHLSKLQEQKFLVNDKLIIEVYLKVSSVLGGLDPIELPEEKKETVCVNGFQVLPSQVKSAKLIFETYPETALYIHPQDPQLKTTYMNILLRIYETLYNSPLEKLTEAELSNVSRGFLDLTQAGFKMEWFRAKLATVSMERKKLSDYEARARELEEQLKNLEMMMCDLKAEIKLKGENFC